MKRSRTRPVKDSGRETTRGPVGVDCVSLAVRSPDKDENWEPDEMAKLCFCAPHSVIGPLCRVSFYFGAIPRRSPKPTGAAVTQQMTWTRVSIAAVPVKEPKGMFFSSVLHCPLRTRCWSQLLEKTATARHLGGVWLHCIILVLEALALSPQSFAKSRAGAVFARVSTPSYNMRESSSIYIYLNVRFVNFVDIGTTVLSLWTAKIARLPMMEPGDQGLPNHLGSTKGRVACLWRRRTTRRRPCVVKGKDQAKHDQPRSRNQTKVAEETPR